MPSRSGVRAAPLRIAVLVLACTTLARVNAARADEPLARWMIEMDGGLTRPHGRIREAFGGGESVHLSLTREVRRHLEVAGAAFEGGMPYALAADEIGSSCIPGGQGRVACSRRSRRQSGVLAGLALGLVVPISLDGGRVVQFGGGRLLARYAVSPDLENRKRTGGGYYGSLGCDLVTLERTVGAGVLLRAARMSTHGDAFGTALPPRTAETWVDFNLLLRLGGTRKD
jgi:hypothetical protein